MENRPVISFIASGRAPGADAGDYERYLKWSIEVHAPVMMRLPEVVGIDGYHIIRESPEYPLVVSTVHFKNQSDWKAYWATSEGTAIVKEVNSWIERGVLEVIWSAAYVLIKSFRSKPIFSSNNQETWIDNAPIMLIQAYRLSTEEQEKYAKWFSEYGCTIFMPLFMKLPGVMGYDWYEDTGMRRRNSRETDYPKYLSIIYFENLKSYEDFIKSPELDGFQKAMRSVFPLGLNYKWHVQYQLVRSYRK